jgi:hypothetical protein
MPDKPFTGKVLALDLATTSGWCHGAPGATPKFGTMKFGKPGGERAAVYSHFIDWLSLFCSAHRVDLIVYESMAGPMIMAGRTNIDTIKLLCGLAEHLEMWAYGKGIELREASVGQVRCHFIGQNLKAAIAKPLTMDICRQRGWMVSNTDEADACALWDYQCCWLSPQTAYRGTPLFFRAKRVARKS